MWVDQCHTKGKSYKKQQLKLKYYLLRKKNYTLKKSFKFQSKCCKESIILNRKFYFFIKESIKIKQKDLFL